MNLAFFTVCSNSLIFCLQQKKLSAILTSSRNVARYYRVLRKKYWMKEYQLRALHRDP